MKKIILGFITFILLITTVLLASCSRIDDAERFSMAREALDNYTVNIDIEYVGGTKYNAVLYVDGNKGKLEFTSEGETSTEYFVEESDITIEEHFCYSNGDVGIFQKLLDVYFEKQDDWYVCSKVGLEALTEESVGTIEFAKLQFKNNKFYKATVAMSFWGSSGQINYTFYDYGKTKV